jgi:nucleotide-binding universal stress UspA family protein
VLLIRLGPSDPTPIFAPETVVIALDGTTEGEAAVPAALALAQALGATLTLLMVIATLGTIPGDRAAAARLIPGATTAALNLEAEAAAAYLAELAERLRVTGVPTHIEVGRGDPVQVTTAIAARIGSPLLALATHGRTGLDALWAGSIGARVVARASGPLLLVSASQPTLS